ncbi:MAG: Sec-independent protein translocase protein TatB [Gemmobacter sp.]
MFDIGWSELLIIGVVALIVIGPRDLPEMFRTLGRVTGKLRSMARDFQRAMESAADQAGVKDVAKDLKSMTSAKNLGLDAVKDAAAKFEKWDPLKPASGKPAPMRPTAASGMAAAATPAAAAPAAAAPVTALGPNTRAPADKVAETAEAIRKARTPAADAVADPPPGSDA